MTRAELSNNLDVEMKRAFALGFALALVSSSFAACTLDFDQFKPGAGGAGTGGNGGTGGHTTMTCNGGCCTAADCPAPADPCKVATCEANVCGSKAQADGSVVNTQTPGDCKKAICKGGAVTTEPDTTDVLDDGNACTDDSCSADGNPQSMPAAAATTCSSNGGTVCDGAGNCVECLVNGNCADPAKPVCDPGTHACVDAKCNDGMKNGTETDTDCGGQCPGCDTGQDCNKDSDCASQKCGPNGKCSAPSCSDMIKNGNETDVDCGGDCNGCGPGQGCNVNGDCAGDLCTGMNGTCAPTCSDGVLNNGESDVDCGGANCNKCGIGKECAGLNSNCQSDLCDANSKCAAKDPNGTMCMSGATCQSGNCTDMVCCASPCQGFCRACNLPGSVGTCMNIPAGQDPSNECAGADTCDGQGGCGTPNGLACANGGDCISGNCVDGVCCSTTCQGTCRACNLAGSMGTCTNIMAGQDPANECAMSSCNGNGACNKPLGQSCAAAGECDSGFCTDGVCCADDCQGLCKACNVAGMAGTCSFIPTGTDPLNECNGANNNCNGAGACTM